ncbi:MAG: hypothetical protein V4474_00965 [Patescibacteria group bacterium]
MVSTHGQEAVQIFDRATKRQQATPVRDLEAWTAMAAANAAICFWMFVPPVALYWENQYFGYLTPARS